MEEVKPFVSICISPDRQIDYFITILFVIIGKKCNFASDRYLLTDTMYMKKITLLMFIAAWAQTMSAQEVDIFEQFALQKRVETPGLENNPAPVLPDITLPWDNVAQKRFEPGKKITTQKQLEKELAKMRKRYAPFMRDLAPKLPTVRKQYELKTFEWILLASEMREDKDGNLYPIPQVEPLETAAWKTVTIPHYTGPINKAEAIYKTQLELTPQWMAAENLYLHFNGIDYQAEVYINGKKAGSHTGLFGAFEVDIKPFVKQGSNTLEIRVLNDSPMMGDNYFLGPNRKYGKKLAASGGLGWDEPGLGKGWTMSPPGFGIWQRCLMEARPAAYIHEVYIHPLVEQRKAMVRIEIANTQKRPCTLSYSLFGQNFRETVAKDITLDDVSRIGKDSLGLTVCQFVIDFGKAPVRLWSLDEPWLYQLQVSVRDDGGTVDARKQQFGMRTFEESNTSVPKGRFYLNGKEIMLRGANMMGNLMQCVMRNDLDQLRDDILLAKIAGMTFWRMTQQPCQTEVYDYFDKLGLLAQTDMPAFNGYRKDAVEEVKPQLVEMMKLIRNHPCNAVISYCNEPDFNKPMMLDRQQHEQLFTLFDAVAASLHPGQVTKWIEGDYINLANKHSDHHCYDTWYGKSMKNQYLGGWFPTVKGWMCACGEFGAEGLDRIQLMQKFFPKKWLDTDPNGKWDPNRIPRCQSATIGKKWLNIKEETMEEWVGNSREYQRWATRLFTEALRRNPKINSFAIHLLIDAWPSSWLKAIMDTERSAKPAYFAYRDALRPVAVNLRPDSFYGFSGERSKTAIFVCNDTPQEYRDATLRYEIAYHGAMLYTGSSRVNISASKPQFHGYLNYVFPDVSNRDKLTVHVGLFDAAGKLIHDSSYDIEIFPVKDKGQQLVFPGGYKQMLIQ